MTSEMQRDREPMIRLVKISLKNFKRFESVDVQLEPFTVLIGSNAAGKSSFLDSLVFLRDTALFGLNYAVQAHGGRAFLPFLHKRDDEVVIAGEWQCLQPLQFPYQPNPEVPLAFQGVEYLLRFKLTRHGGEPIEECVKFVNVVRHGVLESDIQLERQANGEVSVSPTEVAQEVFPSEFTKRISQSTWGTEPRLLLQDTFLTPLWSWFFQMSGPIGADPRAIQLPFQRGSHLALAQDAGNLGEVLSFLSSSERRVIASRVIASRVIASRVIASRVKELLPFVNTLGTIDQPGYPPIVGVKEVERGPMIPAQFLSDGTLRVIALVTAISLSAEASLTILDDVESSTHPSLLRRLVELMVDVVNTFNTQLIITTHSPELLKHVPPRNVLWVERQDPLHPSTIVRLDDLQHPFKDVLEAYGVSEVFAEDLLHYVRGSRVN